MRLKEHLLASPTTTEQVGKIATVAQEAVRPYFAGEIVVGRDLLKV